ncbi:MAG: glucose-1-phosphate adenylyltransferase subunit GlgD [Clostridiales bacterium]|jgi:glucose-1-phosphate adenylyltransferase|nr:glucose-1-phosphate adenylyltransferase subunit GlgD [Clostridiales bacterium]
MKDTMGIILTKDTNNKLYELSAQRAVAAVPFGGRYRIIDFILSSMVNSDISNVGVVTHENYQSLMDHLGAGKEWDLDRKLCGLFIFPPNVRKESVDRSKGTLEELYNIMHYFRRSKEKYVVISESGVICNMQLDDAMEFHLSKEADVTVLYNAVDARGFKELSSLTSLSVDRNGQIVSMEINPRFPKSNKVSMNIYITKKALLETLIDESISSGLDEIESDLLRKNLGSLRIFAYGYRGYVARIDTVRSYFRTSMELLNRNVMHELFSGENPIYTKVKDEVPTMYGDRASVSNSLIADGCVIEGNVQNSILFRGVQISKNVNVANSIILQNSEVHENSVLENVILDKDVIVRVGKRLTGQADYPVLIGKGGVI